MEILSHKEAVPVSIREQLEEEEAARLSPLAVCARNSRGRSSSW